MRRVMVQLVVRENGGSPRLRTYYVHTDGSDRDAFVAVWERYPAGTVLVDAYVTRNPERMVSA